MARWSARLDLGIERHTGQYIVYEHNLQAVRHARTTARVPEPTKWSVDRVKEMLTTAWKSHEPTVPGTIHHQPTGPVETTKKTTTIRRLYIRQEDLTTQGFFQNCPKCQYIITHGQNTPSTVNHSAQGRALLIKYINLIICQQDLEIDLTKE